MKIPFSWLKEMIDLEEPVIDIAHQMTMLGLEVDAIENVPAPFSNVVVGEVLETEKHPNADALVVAKVTDGVEVYQVVCGAPNCRAGMKTAFARLGASLPEEGEKVFQVKKAKIRGVESFGMLCSEKELCLSEFHDGIIDFTQGFIVGQDLAEIYGEVVLDVALTPNLNHCSSILGVARELSALLQRKLSIPAGEPEEGGTPISEKISLSVEDQQLCPRYACRVIEGIKVSESPNWLKKKIMAAGMRSVNNVVDITNYVLLELGHPLHAFDLAKIQGGKIRVRQAAEGEKLLAIDGKEYSLCAEDLVIADASSPIALAGVMGGLDSEVTTQTVDILLESAYFQPTTVRRSSKRYGLLTEASRRFERGADPNQVFLSLERAAALICQLTGGKSCKGLIDISGENFDPKEIKCRASRANSLLGSQLSHSEIENVFARLDFFYSWQDEDTLKVRVPTYRVDIKQEIDLIEEIARLYGYDKFRGGRPRLVTSPMPHEPMFLLEREVRSRLMAEGLQEFLTCDLISPEMVEMVKPIVGEEAIIELINPTSRDQSVMRPSMLPGLLQLAKFNWNHQNREIAGFEIGRIHLKDADNYREQSAVGIILLGSSRKHHWERKPAEFDFYDLKGILENVLDQMGLPRPEFVESDFSTLHTGRQASLKVNDVNLGILGEVHPVLMRKIDLPSHIYYAEINLDDLLRIERKQLMVATLPQFPGSERDWTITLRHEEPIQKVFEALRAVESPIIEKICLRDLYCSERLGKEKKNVTFRIVYRDLQKTLSQEEVDKEHARITEKALRALEKAVI